jgi:RNA polymerase sigma-70 factor (ECF subfamily)
MTLAEASDEGLEARAFRRDDYTQLRLDLVRAVRRICPSWLASRSEDVVQAALIRVSTLVEKGADPRPLSFSYLRKAAYSALVDEIRGLRRRQEVPLPEDSDAFVLHAADPSPERTTASREIGEGIIECLRRLVQSRRLAVTLFLQGHTVPEAAKILGWSGKATENLVFRGLSDLRSCLASKGIAP